MTINLSPGGPPVYGTLPPPFILYAGPVEAGSTTPFILQAVDYRGQPVPGLTFKTLTLTIVDIATNTIVNGVDDIDILNTGRGTLDIGGDLTIIPETSDLTTTLPKVWRAFVLNYTYNQGAVSVGAVQINFLLINLSPLPEC
jgi:hypothetical protein